MSLTQTMFDGRSWSGHDITKITLFGVVTELYSGKSSCINRSCLQPPTFIKMKKSQFDHVSWSDMVRFDFLKMVI